MANHRKRKQSIDGKWFRKVCLWKGVSMNALAKRSGWSSRQIRDGVNNNEMTPELLNACAKALNVHPNYLSGKYGWTLDLEIMADDEVRRHWLETAMAPDSHPYLHSQQEGVDLYEHFRDTLLIHGIGESELMALSYKGQEEVARALDWAETKILREYFCATQSGFWATYEFEDAFQDENDVVEAMADWLEKHGKLAVKEGYDIQ